MKVLVYGPTKMFVAGQGTPPLRCEVIVELLGFARALEATRLVRLLQNATESYPVPEDPRKPRPGEMRDLFALLKSLDPRAGTESQWFKLLQVEVGKLDPPKIDLPDNVDTPYREEDE